MVYHKWYIILCILYFEPMQNFTLMSLVCPVFNLELNILLYLWSHYTIQVRRMYQSNRWKFSQRLRFLSAIAGIFKYFLFCCKIGFELIEFSFQFWIDFSLQLIQLIISSNVRIGAFIFIYIRELAMQLLQNFDHTAIDSDWSEIIDVLKLSTN